MAPLPAIYQKFIIPYQPEMQSTGWFLSSLLVYLVSYFFFPSLNSLLSFSFLLPSFLSFFFSLAVILLPTKYFSLGGSFDGRPEKLPQGTVVVLTGAAAGLGFESSVQLLKRGAKVIVLMRGGPSRHHQVLTEIATKAGKSYPNESLKAIECDLTSFSSILSAAQQVSESESYIDVLLNNAGVMAVPKLELTKDGLEMQIGTNHFGHFLLTSLLIPLLRRSHWPAARVVNVSSVGHGFSQELSESNLRLATTADGYHPFQVYGMSKLANIYFSQQLDERFGKFEKSAEDGLGGIHSYSLHPGAVITELARYLAGDSMKYFFPVAQFFLKLPSQGIQTQLMCCITPERNLIGGEYYADCKLGIRTPLSRNEAHSKVFWKWSEKVTAEVLSKLVGTKVEADFNTWHSLLKKK